MNKFGPGNLIDPRLLEEFRNKVRRMGNLSPEEKGLAIASEVMPLLKGLFPDLYMSHELDPYFLRFGNAVDVDTTDVHGGNDAKTSSETLMMFLGANADALHKATGLSLAKSALRVSDWATKGGDIAVNGRKVGLSKHTIKNWMAGGNGSSYISGELADWLEDQQMDHIRGAPYHPQTQGKIERWHQTLKNRILSQNYYLPGDLQQQIDAFVEHYNHRRYHESLQNLTPADVYFGRGQTMLKQRERIKRKTIETRRLLHRKSAA